MIEAIKGIVDLYRDPLHAGFGWGINKRLNNAIAFYEWCAVAPLRPKQCQTILWNFIEEAHAMSGAHWSVEEALTHLTRMTQQGDLHRLVRYASDPDLRRDV